MARPALVDCAYLQSLPAREAERLDLDAHLLWGLLPENRRRWEALAQIGKASLYDEPRDAS